MERMPPWLASLIVHLAVLILLALFIVPVKGSPGVLSLVCSIEAADASDPGGSSPALEFGDVGAASAREAVPLQELFPVAPPVESPAITVRRIELGDLATKEPLSFAPANTVASASKSVPGGGKPGRGSGRGKGDGKGDGNASFFGSRGTGNNFVFVLDRSASMIEYYNFFDFAKAELLSSVQRLRPPQKFQVIFYNEEAAPMVTSRRGPQLMIASRTSKYWLQRFMESVRPFDGTDHQKALLLAIRMRPDVVYLLTDANEPRLGPVELEQIRTEADGIVINTIEIGFGSQPPDHINFLILLARQNGGYHTYIDINALPLSSP